MGTTASKIYKPSERNKAPVSNKIEEAFFLGQPISDDEREERYIPIVASELMAITVAILPNLVHLGLAENTDSHRRWNFDLSVPTLDALGITTLPLKTFENDYGMPKLLSRTKDLRMLITGGRGEVPEMPNLRGLHIRALDGNYISTGSASPIFESARHLNSFSLTATGTPLSNVMECLDQPRFHASLESIRLDLRCHRDLDGALQAVSSLKLFTRLKKLFVPSLLAQGGALQTALESPEVFRCGISTCEVKVTFQVGRLYLPGYFAPSTSNSIHQLSLHKQSKRSDPSVVGISAS
jgi:hypothetical protein